MPDILDPRPSQPQGSNGPRPFSDIQSPRKVTPTPVPVTEPAVQEEPVVAPEPTPTTSEPTPEPAEEPTPPTESPEAAVEESSTEPTETPNDPESLETTDETEVPAADDAAIEHAVVMKQSLWEKCKNSFANTWDNPRKRYSVIAAILLLVVVPMAVPFTRYTILGLFLKAPVTVRVVDSVSGAPVSGALVSVGSGSAETEANGTATVRAALGSRSVSVSKKYYQGATQKKLITLSAKHNSTTITVKATGHQVKVKLVNKISGKPVAGAVVTAQGATAKSDNNGLATVVLASSANAQDATVTLKGYNDAKVTLEANGDLTKNTINLTPAGKIYFLSNLSGKLDVVKTNLDGTNRQTVLAGTGNEDRNSTSLLASRDWKYLALLSRRSGTNASVYLIDTTNADKLTTIDEGNADFSLVGWSDDRFVYQVTRNTVQLWQPNRQALKSYNAVNGQALLLDQTQASGTSQTDYTRQSFGSAYLMSGQVVYSKNWDGSFNMWSQLASKPAELSTIGVEGGGHKTLKSFTVDAGTQPSNVYLTTQLYAPNELSIYFQTGSKDTFYEYADGKVSDDKEMTSEKFYGTPYPTYLQSPSGSATFWAEQRDGKNTLFTGDVDAKNSKQIASLSAYNTYGWFTDSYLLVSKDSSELSILPVTGGTPLKITDYYKPAITYNGYGGGYGGR